MFGSTLPLIDGSSNSRHKQQKLACLRRKTEVIIYNVFIIFVSPLREELEICAFICIYSDASNHTDLNVFPTIVHFFDLETETRIRILYFILLRG